MSIPSEAARKLQMFVKLLQCGRRQERGVTAVCKDEVIPTHKEFPCGSESGDLSTDDASDQSGQMDCSTDELLAPSLGGSEDSETDVEAKVSSRGSSHLRLAPPPGLDAPPERTPPWRRHPEMQSTLLNGQQSLGSAPPPGLESLQRPMQLHACTTTCHHEEAGGNFVALKAALDKLGPAELATVKTLLDAKACTHLRDASGHGRFGTFSVKRGSYGVGLKHVKAAKDIASTILSTSQKDAARDTESLRQILAYLSSLGDDKRVLALRKINHLGFDASRNLQTYLSRFGTVECVKVSNAKVKGYQDKARLRPAILGFAVMSTAEDAAAALSYGTTHTVAGVEISVLPFQSHSIDNTD